MFVEQYAKILQRFLALLINVQVVAVHEDLKKRCATLGLS